MNRLKIIAGLLVCSAGIAQADNGDIETPLNPLDPVRVISPLTLIQGDGIKVGEGTAIYPQVGFETGFVSNTFYQSTDPVPAGILRLLVEAGLGSLSEQRRTMGDTDNAPSGDLIYDANAYAAYDQYLSNNGNVTSQGGLGVGFRGKVIVNQDHPISFRADEAFDRILRAANYETRTNANRDINTVGLKVSINPDSSNLGGMVQYINQIDVFEDSTENFADRMHNTLIGRLAYRFFPLSSAFLQVSESYDTGIGSASTKVTSFPLVALLGVSTSLTLNTSLVAQAGYTQGFYASGPDYQSPIGGVYFEYRYSPLGTVRLKYGYEHQDSINANFYRDHAFQAWWEQRFAPFAVYLSPELRLREYQGVNPPLMGPPTRDDTIFAAAVGLRYQYRNWLNASAEYRAIVDKTDYRYTGGASMLDPSFVRHEVFAGIRVAY